MTIITMQQWKVHTDRAPTLAFSGENNTEDLYIVPSALEDYTYTLDAQRGSDIGVIPLEKATWNDRDALHVLLTSGQIGAAGTVKLQVVGRNSDGELVKKSNIFPVIVGKSINAASQFADMPTSAFETYVTKAGEYNDQTREYMETTSGYADNAKQSAEESASSATLSESYAHGGTGTRDGEDADNAKAYSVSASKSAQESSDYADKAKKSETAVEDAIVTDGYAKLWLDENGHLQLYRTDKAAERMDFQIKDHKNLEVMLA